MSGTGDSSDGGGLIQGINVTPFVDIVLVLLVVFMVTARLVFTPAEAIPLDLPQASRGEAVQTVLALSLQADGSLYANGQPLADVAELETRARAEHEKDASLSVVIQADGDVPHRRVIQVMDTLGKAGVSKVAFGVQPLPADAAASGADGAGQNRPGPDGSGSSSP